MIKLKKQNINTEELWNDKYNIDTKNHGHGPTWDVIIKNLSDCNTILDYGCGTGFLIERINTKRKNNNAYGYDRSTAAINEAKRRSQMINNYFNNIPQNQKYDGVICAQVLEHLDNPQDLIKLLESLSNNKIILTVPKPIELDRNPHHVWQFEDGDIQSMCSFECFMEETTIGWGGPTRIIGLKRRK